VARRGEIVGALDLGAREVRVFIARKSDDGTIQVLGHGTAPSRGCVSQGVVQDLGAAQLALKRALAAAEKEAGTRLHSLFCGISGRNVKTFIREGNTKLDKGVVELGHLEEALDAGSRDILAAGKRVVSSITSQEWYVDDLRVSDPLGIRGSVLKARVHYAQLPTAIEENILTCIESQGRELEDVVFLPLAAGLGCLTPEDTDLGAAVLDMGHTTTGVVVYRDRRILDSQSFEWGGFHITRDVAAGLNVSFEEATDLVLEYGVSARLIQLHEDGDDLDRAVGVGAEDEQSTHIKLKSAVRGAPSIVERSELDMIIFERSRELMTKVRQFLHARGLDKHLVRGVVLTGGVARIENQDELAKAVFQTPARTGLPEGIDILPPSANAPEFAPVAGVARHGFEFRAAARSGRIEIRRGPLGAVLHAGAGFFRKYFF